MKKVLKSILCVILLITFLITIQPKYFFNIFSLKPYKFLNTHKTSNTFNNSLDTQNQLIINKNLNNIPYRKNSKIPKHLYVIYQDNLSDAEKTMLTTLQGVISNKSSYQIYTLNSSTPDYQIWLDDLKNNYGINYEIIKNPWNLLNKFKSYINGYVLYDHKFSKDPSINNACSLASLKNSIAIDISIEPLVRKHNIKKLVYDCRNTDKYWAYNNLWHKGLNHSTVIELSPNKSAPLRDYAIMSKSLVFYEDSNSDTKLREKIFKSMNNNGICLGWGPDEHENVSIASKCGVSVVAADWSYNLTVLSSFPCKSLTQKNANIIPEDNVHYVTFIMSDGDNQQWNLGNNYGSSKWYGSPYRGKFNMGWSISPSIYYLAPTVFNLYYKNSSSKKAYDEFLVPPSGNGYMYPSKFPKNKLKSYTKTLNNYMKKVDQKYVVVIDDNSFYNNEIWNKYTCNSNIDGIFYLNYHKHNDYNGEISWSNNKPLVSCRDLLWYGIEDEKKLIENINNRVNLGYTNIKKNNAYTFVYVHAWSKTMDDINKVVNELNKNPKVRIVTPNNFIKLIKININ